MSDVQSIINRILSTGRCSVEFLSFESFRVSSYKSLISIASLAPHLGKTRFARYFCRVLFKKGRRVSVIFAVVDFFDIQGGGFKIENCSHFS
jgi:predicted GTPase